MDNKSRCGSDISLDSLETEFKKESLKQRPLEENVDTILIPLYEKDVLIKVPKRKKKQNQQNQYDDKSNKKNSKPQKEACELTNYLVNKESRRMKKSSYLEMFRKQFTSHCTEIQHNKVNDEIRSISPEFGDTERESIGDVSNNPAYDFYNTESYNDIYYDRLMKKELNQYLKQSFEDILHLDEDGIQFSGDINENNLRSVSEVSQPRRRAKSKIIAPIQNVRLGGLGPDMETIKPRLERARSLQRYSEKVRMENRLKIYKKEVQNEKPEREASATRREPIPKQQYQKENTKKSYLINKTLQEKPSLIKKICQTKSKSADVQKHREVELKERYDEINNSQKNKRGKVLKTNNNMIQKNTKSARDQSVSSDIEGRSLRSKIKGVNEGSKQNDGVSPLQISFMVNVGGVRPSTALKSLEEKHRMYQEKVKQYSTNINNV